MPSSQGSAGSSQTVNTSQTTDTGPWKTQQPYLGQQFHEAQRLYNQGAPQYFPTNTVSPFTQPQLDAIGQITGMGTQSPLIPTATDLANKTMSGGFLDPSSNPWLKSTFAAGADDVTRAYQTATAPQTASSFSGGGRYGSGSYALMREGDERALGSTLNNLATSIYGGNYQAERDRQLGTMGSVGNLISASYLTPTALMNVGKTVQDQTQAHLTDDVNRWNYNQNQEWENLQRYRAMTSGNYGQQGTMTGTQQTYSQQPYFENIPMQIAGMLLGGAKTAGSMGWKPFG